MLSTMSLLGRSAQTLVRGCIPVLVSACTQPLVIRSERGATVQPSGAFEQDRGVHVHGMFMTPLCWEKWEPYFQAKGYKTLAPAWPEHDARDRAAAQVSSQRKAGCPHAGCRAGSTTGRSSKGLEEKPILVGHSMGGLDRTNTPCRGVRESLELRLTLLLRRASSPCKYSFLKSNWPAISPSAKIDVPIQPVAQGLRLLVCELHPGRRTSSHVCALCGSRIPPGWQRTDDAGGQDQLLQRPAPLCS
jgi:hypothetical protein